MPTYPITCLSRTAQRAAAADLLHDLAPEIDGLLFVDLLDAVSRALLKSVNLTDKQARVVMSVLWQLPDEEVIHGIDEITP